MSYVDDAFALLKSGLEITQTERDLASTRQNLIRQHLDTRWDIADHFLTGSYRRETKTKPLTDVDIFVVLDPKGKQAKYAEKTPSAILEDLRDILEEKWKGKVTIDRMAAVISYGDDVASFEVTPAFKGAPEKPNAAGYHIPDTLSAKWIRTDPSDHADRATAKNKRCDEKWIPLVKMIKGANRELGEPVQPSFLLEVMALTLIDTPFGRYQDELSWFFATAADRLNDPWPDPAGLGPDVNAEMSQSESASARAAFGRAHDISQRAVWLEDHGQDKAAVEEWRRLFANRMPRP
jgi:predicted nucleotidyltransferase